MKNVVLVQPDLDLDRSFENVNEFFAGMFGVLTCLGVRCCRDLVGFHGPSAGRAESDHRIVCQFEGSPLAGADEAGRSSLALCQE